MQPIELVIVMQGCYSKNNLTYKTVTGTKEYRIHTARQVKGRPSLSFSSGSIIPKDTAKSLFLSDMIGNGNPAPFKQAYDFMSYRRQKTYTNQYLD